MFPKTQEELSTSFNLCYVPIISEKCLVKYPLHSSTRINAANGPLRDNALYFISTIKLLIFILFQVLRNTQSSYYLLKRMLISIAYSGSGPMLNNRKEQPDSDSSLLVWLSSDNMFIIKQVFCVRKTFCPQKYLRRTS